MTTTTENVYVITKENYQAFADKLAYAVVKTGSYNSDCFGMSDLKLADAMEYTLGQFIDFVIDAGYCPYALLNESLGKSGLYIKEESKRPDLKQQADESLSIDMSKLAKNILYVEHCSNDMDK